MQSIEYKLLKQLICSCISDNIMERPKAVAVCRQIFEIQNSPTAVAYDALTSLVSFQCDIMTDS